MNIAIFTHNYPKNKKDRKDAGIFIHNFGEELSKKHKVFIFCPDYGNNEKFGNWSILNPLNIFKFFKNIAYGISESLIFVKKNKIDYVLSAWAIPSGIYAFVVKLKYKIPYGVWYLGSDINFYSKIPVLGTIISILSKNADNLFANSNALSKIAITKYGSCMMLPASTKVSTISKNKLIFDRNKVNILYVGRLEKVKGPDILVKAFKELDDKFTLRVIGSGTMRDKLEKEDNKVIFLGRMNMFEISNYMRNSDFLIIPSRNESLPLVILEAANFRLPILASNVGDCKFILDKYKIGDTFEKGNLNQMVSKIKTFRYKNITKYGRFSKLVIDYSLKVSVNKFLNKI